MPKKSSSIEETINYHAKDSIHFDVKAKKAHLYGDAHVDYGKIILDANYIIIDWQDKTVLATFTLDSNRNKIGIPRFQDDGDVFNVDTVKYNWENKKGYITDLISKQSGGYMFAEKALKDSSDILYASNAKFCPCLDSAAGTYIQSKKIKVIPEKRVYTGPFLLYVEDIPLPLGGPFGLFPISNKKSSGIIIPQFGERQDRGFSLTEGGFYWAVNDYVGAKLLGEIYTKGGWGLSLISNYKKRYKFDGNFNFSYRKIVSNNDEINRLDQNVYQLRWFHAPQSRGKTRFSANVNFASVSYNKTSTRNVNDYLNNQLNSTITYSFPIGKLFNVTTTFRHEQNNTKKTMGLTLPSFTANLKNRIYPFKRKDSSPTKSIPKNLLQKLNIGYTLSGQNTIRNDKVTYNVPFQVANYNELDTAFLEFDNTPFTDLLKRNKFGMKHYIPIATSTNIGVLNFNANATYNEYWLPKSWDYETASDSSVNLNSIQGFNRFSDYSMSAGVSTNIYGKFFSKRLVNGKNKWAIRQRLTPSANFQYSPDYSIASGNNDNYETITLQGTEYNVSRFQSLAYTPKSSGLSKTLGFGLSSNVEMKRFSKNDTTGKAKYIKLLENISINSGYNFAADSLNFSDFRVNANTRLFNLISINFSSSFTPYTRVLDSNENVIKTNTFRLKSKNELVYMDNMRLNISTSLNPKVFKGKQNNLTADDEYLNRFLAFNPDVFYTDYDIPWNLRLSYGLTLNRFELRETKEEARKIIQTFSANGDLSLTPKWKFTYGINYDFINKRIVTPNIGISRDLNCWEMRMNWVPFGQFTQYNFNINIKSAMLKDVLKYKRRNNFTDSITF